MAKHTQTRQVVSRLARIEGHIGAVKRMVEDGRSCSDILLQIAAVRAAIDRTAKVLLTDHMEHCLTDMGQDGKLQKHLAELRQALERFIS
jgi:DNA-binding FrmR family transcriptional regulator